jgi:hypothetical protein
MVDLVDFLHARLDEDAARATAAGGDEWRRQDHPSDTIAIYDSKGEPVVYDEGWPTEEQQEHITCHDPARVLAEVEAKRRAVAKCAEWLSYGPVGDTEVDRAGDGAYVDAAETMLRLLALPYADHPAFKSKWRP